MKTVKILIPFHKAAEKLEKCLKHVKASDYTDYTIEIQDDSKEEHGFTKTVNRLITKVLLEAPDYLLVLNQDCYLGEDTISQLVGFMDNKPNCLVCGVKQVSTENEDVIIHGGTGACYPSGRHEGGLVSKGDCNQFKKVPWVNGACFMIKTSLLVNVGLLDENMVMFGSDADFCYTTRARGFECWYNPKAVVKHEQGISREMSSSAQKQFMADMRYFRDKWISGDLYKDLAMEIF